MTTTMDLPTSTIENTKKFFNNLPEVDRDQKITSKFIKEHLDVSERGARTLISSLEVLGFIDKNNVPTLQWWNYLERPRETLRPIVKELYRHLYERYEDPYLESPKAIMDALRLEYNHKKEWAEAAVRCFRTLHEIASHSPKLSESAIETQESNLAVERHDSGITVTLTLKIDRGV